MKVLDFGLAKPFEPTAVAAASATMFLTLAQIDLGTPRTNGQPKGYDANFRARHRSLEASGSAGNTAATIESHERRRRDRGREVETLCGLDVRRTERRGLLFRLHSFGDDLQR